MCVDILFNVLMYCFVFVGYVFADKDIKDMDVVASTIGGWIGLVSKKNEKAEASVAVADENSVDKVETVAVEVADSIMSSPVSSKPPDDASVVATSPSEKKENAEVEVPSVVLADENSVDKVETVDKVENVAVETVTVETVAVETVAAETVAAATVDEVVEDSMPSPVSGVPAKPPEDAPVDATSPSEKKKEDEVKV